MANASIGRRMGNSIIMLSNLFLVWVNCSDRDFVVRSIIILSKDRIMWAACIGTLLMLVIILYSPLSVYLKPAPLTILQLVISVGIAAAAVP